MKQLLLPLLATTAFIIIIGLLFGGSQKGSGLFQTGAPSPTTGPKTIQIGTLTLKITLADTQEKRQRGLSGVASLPQDEGILFIFEKKGVMPPFWMKGMLIPIDIIWIKDNKVSQIDKNIQPPDKYTPDAGLKLYKPSQPIDYVLEVNAGFADKNNLKVGDKVDLSGV